MEHKKQPMIIWEFDYAPIEMRQLSLNAGDEDWIAEIPPDFNDGYIPSWLDGGTAFGRFCVDEYDHPNKKGWKIRIGCHA